MISITDLNLPKFQKLINRADFLAASNPAEDRISTQLLSNALIYESNSFAAFNNVTSNNTDNHI